MKRLFAFSLFLFNIISIFGQAPAGMKYQAVLRDSRGNIKVNTATTINIDILEGGSSRKIVYSENHYTTTNIYGLINLEIGNGSVTNGSFSDINWSKSTFFVRVYVDGVEMGTDQLLSVPYALHSNTAEKLTGKTVETDPVFIAAPASMVTESNIFNWNASYGWGNHASAGYLKAFSETDPMFNNWNKSSGIDISASQVNDFDARVAKNPLVLENTSKHSFPTADATKLLGISAGAEVNVNADWNATNGDAQILNKPPLTSGTVTSITGGTGITGGTVTTFGIFAIDTTIVLTKTSATALYQPKGISSLDIHTNIKAINDLSGTNTGDQDLSGKADKVDGKSLVADTEIAKIHASGSDNQDISAMSHTNRTALDAVAGTNTGDQDLSGKADKVDGKSLVADTEIAKIHASGSDNQDISAMSHTNRTALDAVAGTNTGDQDLSGKADKVDGKSLVADTEIAKIHASGSDNQDISAMSHTNRTALDAVAGTNTGDQDLSGKADKVDGKSLVADTEIAKIHASGSDNQDISAMSHTNRTALDAVAGTNTGDQDLSGKADKVDGKSLVADTEIAKIHASGSDNQDISAMSHTNRTALDAVAGTNTGDQDLSGKADKVDGKSLVADSEIAKIHASGSDNQDISAMSHTNRTALDAVAGTNTGDQDLSGKADKVDGKSLVADSEIAKIHASGSDNQDISAMSHTNRTALDAVAGTNTGDQDLSGKADKVDGKSLVADSEIAKIHASGSDNQDISAMSHTNRTALDAVAGTNTGDQDLSGKADKVDGKSLVADTEIAKIHASGSDNQDISAMSHTNRTALDAVAGTNTGDQDLSGKADKVDGKSLVADSEIAKIHASGSDNQDISAMSHTNRTALDAVAGTNTGDQDLSGKADKVDGKSLVADTEIAKIHASGSDNQDISAMSHTNRTALDAVAGTNTGDQNGSETIVTAGTNVTVTGVGTAENPYKVNATSSSSGFTHYIGELYGGGIIVAVWKVSGVEKGLIASLADVSTSAKWSSITATQIGVTAQSPIDGQANTTAIVAQGDVSGAAYLCNNYVADGFSDWYLPAIWELNQCYNAALVVNITLGSANGFQFASYWSSTELTSNSYTQYFTSGYSNNSLKTTPCRVRAVRRF